MSLGRQTHLKAKAVGENSMSGKPGCHEAAKRQARQGPDGMVKAALPEPQCPNSKGSGRQRRMTAGCSHEDLAFLASGSQHSRGAGPSIMA